MISPARFNPTQGLVVSEIESGTLVGFRRLARQPPAVLLPVFVVAPAKGGKRLLYQRIDEGDCIAEFVIDPDLRLGHLLPLLPGQTAITVSTGNRSVHAYEIAPGRVIAAQGEAFRRFLLEMLSNDELAASPFAALEVARYVGDEKAEVSYALRCIASLEKRSLGLATAWVSGARLSPIAHLAAEEKIDASKIVHEQAVLAAKENREFKIEAKATNHPRKFSTLPENPNHDSWARIWRETRKTLSNPELRNEFDAEGLNWLDAVNQNHGGWVSVWLAIWEDATDQTSLRYDLIGKGNRWLTSVDPNHSRWPIVWETLFATLPGQFGLIDHGLRWLDEVDPNHHAWAYVWDVLWRACSTPEIRSKILLSARKWLDQTNPDHFRWRFIWGVLWRAALKDNHESEVKELATNGLRWLALSDPNRRAWTFVWDALRVSSRSGEIRRRLLELGIWWLGAAEIVQPDWPHVWIRILEDTEALPNHRTFLITKGRAWLNTNKYKSGWRIVWDALLKASVNEPGMRSELTRHANIWLQTNQKDPAWEKVRRMLSNWEKVWEMSKGREIRLSDREPL